MKTETFECEDSYEAKKLAGLLARQDNSIYISGIAGAVKNEIIIVLKDKSSHSVTLKDENNVRRLKLLVEAIVTGEKIISGCLCENHSSQVSISTK